MPSLSLSTASRIAFRELRHSRGKFAFVVLSVAIGVAALTGVRGFASSFRTMLLLNARSIMAADIGARMNRQPTAAERTTLASLTNIKQTEVTELTSMASSAKSMDPLIVSVKAIDPAAYPFYGKVDLAPSQSLSQALTNNTIAVGDDLLFRLHLNPGMA